MTDTVLSAYTGDLTQMLSTVSSMAARPAFNLAFSNMQTLAATRYNDKVSAIQQKALDSYDVNLDKELKNLQELQPKLTQYQYDVNSARNLLIERYGPMSDLDTLNSDLQAAATAGHAVDPTEFNAKVDSLNASLKILPFVDGSEFSDYGDDGVGNLRLKGSGVNHFSVDNGAATPPTGSSAEMLKARTAINNSVELLANRLDMVTGQLNQVTDRIDEIKNIQQTKVSDVKADVAKQAQQLKLQLSEQLQSLSISFEAQQAQNEQITKAFTNDTYQAGSVVNLFS